MVTRLASVEKAKHHQNDKERFLSMNGALNELYREFEHRVSQAVKSLLESKHLYQGVTLEYEDLIDGLEADGFSESIQANWFPIDRADPRNYISQSGDKKSPICFETPDVKLFCRPCERIEAFNSISSEDFSQRESTPRYSVLSGQRVQGFIFSFLCQSCKSVPEVFLVRRQGLKLTNSGRSPIEYPDVPSVIPNSVKRFYRGAILAHQSGQTLAGIFLLRTVIEQWARSKVPCGPLLTEADAVLDAYMATLPDDFKSRFPSFRVLYADLSTDMHAAKGDADLFDRARDEIVEHFDASRLFKL
jgi:hypothetical protein